MIKIINEDFNLEEEFSKISSKEKWSLYFLGTVRDDIFKNEKKIDVIIYFQDNTSTIVKLINNSYNGSLLNVISIHQLNL